MEAKKKRGPKPGFWIKYHISECVLCGRSEESREFIYDRPKPKDKAEQWVYFQYACDAHFM